MKGTESICRIDRSVENVEAPRYLYAGQAGGLPSPVSNRALTGRGSVFSQKVELIGNRCRRSKAVSRGRLAGAGGLRWCRRAGVRFL